MTPRISEAAIRRLPGYYRHLKELERSGVESVSSAELGERLKQNPSQIRQDINSVGGIGRQGYGYPVSALRARIGEILGVDQPHRAIILGAGSIGTAVARYKGFADCGFLMQALFDVAEEKIGSVVEGLPVLPLDALAGWLAENPVEIAVIAVPAQEAAGLLEPLARCGVRAVWNFAPIDLQLYTDTMAVVNVHLCDSLQVLSYKLKLLGETSGAGEEADASALAGG